MQDGMQMARKKVSKLQRVLGVGVYMVCVCVVHDPTLFAAAILSIKFCFVGSLRFGKASSQFASAWKSIARIMKGLEKPPKKDQPKRLRGWQLEMQSGRKVAKKSVLERLIMASKGLMNLTLAWPTSFCLCGHVALFQPL